MAKIIINKGKPTERTVPLEFETTTLGRASDNVVVLPELYISRQHMIIEKRSGGYYAHNLSSTTGTVVNQQRVEEALLKPGDVIQLGETTIHFLLEPGEERTMVIDQPTVVMPAVPVPPVPLAPPPSPPGLRCSKCNNALQAGDVFCGVCGTPAKAPATVAPAPFAPPALKCPKCGAAVQAGDVFCGVCGASLKAAAGAPAPPPAPPLRPPVPPVPSGPPPRESYSDPQLKVPMAPAPPSVAPPSPPPIAPPPPPRPPAPSMAPPPMTAPPMPPPPPRPTAAAPPRPGAPMAPAPMPGAANYLNYPKAGFGARLVAYIIDTLILSLIGFVLVGLPMIIFMGGAIFSAGRSGDMSGALGAVGTIVMFGGMALFSVISILYFLWYWAKKGCTPGKKMMGLRIITINGDCPVGWGPAFLRYLGYLVLSIGCWFILFDAEKRGLHDMIAKTYVVKIK